MKSQSVMGLMSEVLNIFILAWIYHSWKRYNQKDTLSVKKCIKIIKIRSLVNIIKILGKHFRGRPAKQ
jgi:hypothetical protein